MSTRTIRLMTKCWGKINSTKAHYNEQLQAFMKVAVDPQDFSGLYETMRTEAHNAFNEVNLGIVAVERKNGTNENHQTAEEGYEANTHALDSLYEKTDEVYKFYTDSIQNNDNIYKALIAERTDGKSPWALLAELKKMRWFPKSISPIWKKPKPILKQSKPRL